MEGLLIADVLDRLRPRTPAERIAFRFLDADTIVLPLVGGPSIWMFSRPPNPLLETRDEVPSTTGTHTGFQDLLASRSPGRLERVMQPKLDRVAIFEFAAGEGFVRTDPCRLIFELTGRNCNVILTDLDDVILGAAREVPASINRYRQVRPGLTYQPPPPYEKLDPRHAPRHEMADALRDKKLKNLHKALDGIGPDLVRAIAILARSAEDAPLKGEILERALDAVEQLASAPTETLHRALDLPDVATLRRREHRQELEERATHALRQRLDLARKRIEDGHRTLEAAAEADEVRSRADILMAYGHQVPDHVDRVELEDFSGEPIAIDLDPKRDAIGNAEAMYAQARKRERRGDRAARRIAELEGEVGMLEERLGALPEMRIPDLEDLVESLEPKPQVRGRSGPGIRFRGPHDFEIVVGRNAKDNDAITFQLARSRDVWLHVQGYHGSHVIVRAENQEVPFDTILFAAQLAAGHSQAAGSDNVPVDYTQKKNVWKPKGTPPGAVRFTQQKTVYVTPRRQVPREDTPSA